MIPWIPYAAATFLEAILSEEMRVFEYGSGGSTLFFASRVKSVVSVEHDEGVYQSQKEVLPSNCEYLFVSPESSTIKEDKADPLAYWSEEYPGYNFKAYASAIDRFGPFDLVFVDGRARPSCLYHAYVKVKEGGYLLLDNSDRTYYLENVGYLFKDWERYTFFGKGPYNDYPWEATVWKHVGIYSPPADV